MRIAKARQHCDITGIQEQCQVGCYSSRGNSEDKEMREQVETYPHRQCYNMARSAYFAQVRSLAKYLLAQNSAMSTGLPPAVHMYTIELRDNKGAAERECIQSWLTKHHSFLSCSSHYILE
nr:hypothetical protein Iba_chr10aCG0130 [Ipomoea batatas]